MAVDANINNPNSFYTGADNANKLLQSFATRRAGQQLAAGSPDDAVKTLQGSGQLDEANQMQEHQIALQQHTQAFQTKMVSDIATSLDNVGTQFGWDKVIPAFDRLAPMFKAQGATDAQLQQLRSAIAADPQTTIRGISANAQKEMEQYTLNPGAIRYDANGHIVAQGNPRYQALGPDQSLVATDQPGQAASGNGAAPAGGALDGGTLALPGLESGASDASAVQTVESGGDPNAVSSAGAVGTMQTLPSTLNNPGYGVSPAQPGQDGSIPAAEQTRVGKDYLAALSQHYHSPVLGLIAYNWGPGKMERWIAGGAQIQKLPPDVRQYLGSVLVAHSRNLPMPPPPSQHADDAGLPHRLPFQGPQVVMQGKPSFRPPTDAEKEQFPGVDFMTTKGPHYPPSSVLQQQGMPDDNAVRIMAQTHMLTGQMPSLGMNNAALRNKMMQVEGEIAKEHGWTGADIANLRAQYKSTSTALSKLQTQRAQIGAYEQTVQGSMNIVEEVAPKALANSGFTSSNKAINWWKRETNDPDMAQLDNSINTVVNEYAKVISNATGGGVTSDAARSRAEELVNSADSAQSLHAKLQILRREMDIRVNSMDKGMAMLTGHIHSMLDDPNHATTVARHLAKPTKQGHYDPVAGKVVWQ